VKVNSAICELLPPSDGPFVARVVISGEGFDDEHAAPLLAIFGDISVDVLRMSKDGTTAAGLLTAVPPNGTPLRIGYMNDPELSPTDVTFQIEEA